MESSISCCFWHSNLRLLPIQSNFHLEPRIHVYVYGDWRFCQSGSFAPTPIGLSGCRRQTRSTCICHCISLFPETNTAYNIANNAKIDSYVKQFQRIVPCILGNVFCIAKLYFIQFTFTVICFSELFTLLSTFRRHLYCNNLCSLYF